MFEFYSISAVQSQNREIMSRQGYRGMESHNSKADNVRYLFLPSDNATLYRKFSRLHGVDVRRAPEYNLDDWLNPESPLFKPDIHEAIFHYKARSEKGERLQVCISTREMDEAAWKYAHHSQVVLDGTFGVCSTRLLLFIALAVDDHRKGVPIAFFLFSAPTGNRATQAGYNTEILHDLLSRWKIHLSHGSKELFTPFVAITDTDTKERGALLLVWPAIILLLCKFHLRQCWTNHRKAALRSGGSQFFRDHVRDRLRNLEIQYVFQVQWVSDVAN